MNFANISLNIMKIFRYLGFIFLGMSIAATIEYGVVTGCLVAISLSIVVIVLSSIAVRQIIIDKEYYDNVE